jgi:hypothetical protein
MQKPKPNPSNLWQVHAKVLSHIEEDILERERERERELKIILAA